MAKYPKQYEVLTTEQIGAYAAINDPAFMIQGWCVQTATIASFEKLCESNPAWGALKWVYSHTDSEEGASAFYIRSSLQEVEAAVVCFTGQGNPISAEDASRYEDVIIVPKGVSWHFRKE
jgi:hypothetical protein